MRCPRCQFILALRGPLWGCLRPTCAYERAARPGDLGQALVRLQVAAHRAAPAPGRLLHFPAPAATPHRRAA